MDGEQVTVIGLCRLPTHGISARAGPRMLGVMNELEIADWRRRVHAGYARVREADTPWDGFASWRTMRDEMFTAHTQSPLPSDDPLRSSGIPYYPYDPALRFHARLEPEADGIVHEVPSANDGTITMRRIGRVALPDPVGATLDVWWLAQYGGGIFLPLRDGTSGRETYGGGRYLLDTAKGADLGSTPEGLVIDLNFCYHPSCRYNPAWECPLAPEGNTIDIPIHAGERLLP